MRLMRVVVMLVLVALLAGVAAAQSAQIRGEVRDAAGKPFPDVVVSMTHEDTGQKFEVKTDKNGRWSQTGMRPGIWTIQYIVQGKPQFQERRRLSTGSEESVFLNFKDEIAKQDAAQTEASKKMAEDQSKFNTMKAHFEAGRAALEQGQTINSTLRSIPADQKQAKTDEMTKFFETAVTEFQGAQKAAGEKDQNLHLILFNLGDAYAGAGRYDEAIAAYQQAVTLKPTQAEYYVNMSSAQARGGKVVDATATCDKVAAIEPTNAAMCYRNIGIVLYNVGNMKEAVIPLRKATELDASNPEQWYLLGAALVNTMEYKKEGDKMVPVVPPGTVEAYMKCLELAPNGRFAEEAKAGLEMLRSLGVGIPTKLTTGKKKKGQ